LAVLGEREVDWHDLLATATRHDPVPVQATDPLYILYTSGTTGKPKGVVRDNGGHAVAMAWSFRNVYGMGQGDVWWAASDIGWVVGHSYIVYAPLICGATTVMYEGKPVGTPDAGAFWRVIAEYRVNGLFVAPTAIRAIRKEDSAAVLLKEYDVTSLRTLFMAGERLDPSTFEWASEHLHIPVVDNWWQTESGWPIASNLQGLDPMPIKPGSPSVIVPGYDVKIFDGEGREQPAGAEGAIVIKLPMPPGTLPTLWGDDQRFIDSYLNTFPGYYTTGDSGYFDDEKYLYVMGRTDDVINVAGHRLSTGSLEAVVAANEMVAECAVIGVFDEIKGQIPRAFVVLKAGVEVDPKALRMTIVDAVRDEIGPVAALKEVVIVPALPKTRSGKMLRATMRGIADGREVVIPSTIEDIAVLEAITPLLQRGTSAD
ncbi:MAG: AMP-binding protein, partial [Actinobacteria bacterium]|nr:AMP-binding protein [Actinomycetota bacterium]